MGQSNSVEKDKAFTSGVEVDLTTIERRLSEQELLDKMIDDTVSQIKREGSKREENRLEYTNDCDSDSDSDDIPDLFNEDGTIYVENSEECKTSDVRSSNDTELSDQLDHVVVDEWTNNIVQQVCYEIDLLNNKENTGNFFTPMMPPQTEGEIEDTKFQIDGFLNNKNSLVSIVGVSMDRFSTQQKYMYKHHTGEFYTFWMKNGFIFCLEKYKPTTEDDASTTITEFPFMGGDFTIAAGAGIDNTELTTLIH